MSEKEHGTLPLSADEGVALVAWQHFMLTTDLAHTRSARLAKASNTAKKEALADTHLTATKELFEELNRAPNAAPDSAWPPGANPSLHDVATALAGKFLAVQDGRRGLVLDRGARSCAQTLDNRIQALRLQIESHAYQPWPPKIDWDSDA